MQLLISLDMWTRKRLHAQRGCTINRVRHKRTGDEEHHHLVAIIVYLWGIEDNAIKRPPLFEPSAKANSLWTMTCLQCFALDECADWLPPWVESCRWAGLKSKAPPEAPLVVLFQTKAAVRERPVSESLSVCLCASERMLRTSQMELWIR